MKKTKNKVKLRMTMAMNQRKIMMTMEITDLNKKKVMKILMVQNLDPIGVAKDLQLLHLIPKRKIVNIQVTCFRRASQYASNLTMMRRLESLTKISASMNMYVLAFGEMVPQIFVTPGLETLSSQFHL